MVNLKSWPYLAALAALVLTLTACGGSSSDDKEDPGLEVPDVVEEDTGTDIDPVDDADTGSDTTRPPQASDLDCNTFCPLLQDCGYLDLAAGLFSAEQCPGFCLLLRGGTIPGVGDVSEAAACFSQVETCDGVPDCPIPFIGALPPIDQACVAQCRRWEGLTEDCAPPIVNELTWSVFGEPRNLWGANDVTAFVFDHDTYAAGVAMFREALPDAEIWETPDHHLVTVIGVDHAWLTWAFEHPDVREVIPGFRDVEGRAAVHHGQFIVRIAPEAGLSPVKFLEDAGFTYVAPALADAHGYLVRFNGSLDDAFAAVTLLDHHKDVLSAEPDLIRFYRAMDLGPDPLFAQQWHLESTGQSGALLSASVRAVEAWRLEVGDPEILIAINDDGVDFEHEDLVTHMADPVLLNGTLESALQNNCCSHGTAVAGVAAATGGNGIGVRGVCPSCGIIPMFAQIVGFGANDSTVAGSFRAATDAGASVINNSWGMSTGSPIHTGGSMFGGGGGQAGMPGSVQSALTYADEEGRDGKGMVIVFAAGNDNSPPDYFGRHPLTVTVGSTTDQSRKAWYSSFGEELVVSAPSNGGVTSGITTTDVTGTRGYDRGNYTSTFGGTSSAAPLVAGLAGLVLSANPELTAAEVRALLAETADRIDPLRGRYSEDGHSPIYGFGRVNAYRAVHRALELAGTCVPADEEACNGVDDLCDGEIDTGCDRVETCGACLFHEQCESGICAHTPNDATERCLPSCSETSDCDEDWTCEAGACVPPNGRCDALLDEEVCNGLDDTGTGEADVNPDGTNACNQGTGRCVFESQCRSGFTCLGQECRQICSTDQDCQSQNAASCVQAKDAWGNELDISICVQGLAANCVNSNCVGPPFGVATPGFANRLALCLDEVEFAPGSDEERCGGYFECATWIE